MPNWWDNGLQGKTGYSSLTATGGVIPVGGFRDMPGASSCGSIVLRETEGTYSQLLYTSESGVQIYADVTSYLDEDVQLYRPTETRNVRVYSCNLRLYRNGTSLSFGNGSNVGAIIAGTTSLKEYQNRSQSAEPPTTYAPDRSFPRTGDGNVQTIAVASSDAGLAFYVIGAGGYYEPLDYNFIAPCYQIGLITSATLNNTMWFNPDADRLPDQEKDVSGTSGDFNNNRNVQYDYPGTDIDFPGLPTNSVLGLSYYKIFIPSSAQLTSAFDILWVSGVGEWWEILSKIFYKPQQFIVSLMMFPFTPSTQGSAEIKFGMYPTGVTAPVVGSQWQTINCGTLNIPLKYGSALDYSPYTQAQIFLPFVGIRSINIDMISGGSISVQYHVDMLTGSSMCFVKVANYGSNTSVLYTYDCNVAMQVPIQSSDYSQLFTSLFGMGTALTHPSATGMLNAGGDVASSAISVATLSGKVEQSGHLSSNNGLLSGFKPYVIIEQPVQSLPNGYAGYEGFPSNITSTLSGLNGYTEVESIHLQIPGATEEELRDIEEYLHNGVIL